MTRHEMWVEVRYRLVVIGVAAVVLAAFWASVHSSVRINAPGGTRFVPLEMSEYAGAITEWTYGDSWIGGWVENRHEDDCPALVIWAAYHNFDGGYTQGGYINIGTLAAHQRIAWAGYLTDPTIGRPPLRGKPAPSGYTCYWTTSPA